MQVLKKIFASIAAFALGLFGFSQWSKRRQAEKTLEDSHEIAQKQKNATNQAVKDTAEEKKSFEQKKNNAPEDIPGPVDVNERLGRLRKPSKDNSAPTGV